jgi:hypothetical protein
LWRGSDSNVAVGFAFAGGTRCLARVTAQPKRSGPAVQVLIPRDMTSNDHFCFFGGKKRKGVFQMVISFVYHAN